MSLEEKKVAELTLHNVCKKYQPDAYAVEDFSLEMKGKEFIVFVGPSGCGKSTVLRMIAGLEDITSGELWMNGNLMNYTEPKERNVSMVFQNYALYPNMTVYDNMAFSLQIRGVKKKEIRAKVEEVAKMLEIDALLERRPAALSGGQRQRVAIGSAILREPDFFLMDEPLSNLDAKLRTQMRIEIAKLYHSLNASVIYVTHDQTEAMTLGTKIVVLKEGKIMQVDTPQNLYEHPANRFVAGFIGSPSMNFGEVQIALHGNSLQIESGDFKFSVEEKLAEYFREKGYWGKYVTLGIRPECIHRWDEVEQETLAGMLTSRKCPYTEPFEVEVEATELLGSEQLVFFRVEQEKWCMRADADLTFLKGENIEICFERGKMQFFDRETEQNILQEETGR